MRMGETLSLNGREIPVRRCRVLVIGTGAAGYAAACRLYDGGVTDVLIASERRLSGTSRNTGSDKQTYYKLTLCGDEPDSVAAMAQTLFDGGCVDGDHALAEAACSVRCFVHLAELGLPFPTNRYGEYIGYKTDHDPKARATSIGPLTSMAMTQALETQAQQRGIPLLDNSRLVRLLTQDGRCFGALFCATAAAQEPFSVVLADFVVCATGGPAGIYASSAYPASQSGASGVIFAAGAAGKNLTEWQYGLASVKPRWNVSGTYMQALPRLISTDAAGNDAREFLSDYLPPAAVPDAVFLKGYQWPFDTAKLNGGSSLVDLAVYMETTRKGRRVFLDFTQNPAGLDARFSALSEPAYTYLQKAGALFGTPYERLVHMNAPAVAFYREKGVDLRTQMLEIALCAQHNNGGADVDRWWQSSLCGLFVIGEAAGTHGVCRPGGSALNAGQVGALRAAQYICAHASGPLAPEPAGWERQILPELLLSGRLAGAQSSVARLIRAAQTEMSACAAAIRTRSGMRRQLELTKERLARFDEQVRIRSQRELDQVFRYRDILWAQQAYLTAFLDYLDRGGASRGSALYLRDADEAAQIFHTPPERAADDRGSVQLTEWTQNGCVCRWRAVRPIPQEESVFETVWRGYRENGNID